MQVLLRKISQCITSVIDLFTFQKNIIDFIRSTKYDRIYFSLFDQLIRSSSSIGANLVEGTAGVSNKDYINYNGIALKSANETKYWLCLVKESDLADKQKQTT